MNRFFSAEDLRVVVPALREVRLVWCTVQEEGFVDRVMQRLGGNRKAWTAANLALFSLDLDMRAEELSMAPLVALPSEICQRAKERYAEWSKAPMPPKTLAEAGLLALALREMRKSADNWNEVLRQISQALQSGESNVYENWSAVMACLMGVVADGRDLLKGLMGRRVSSPVYELIGTAIFSLPLLINEQANLLLSLLGQLSSGQQISWLRRLRYEGRQELTKRVAVVLLKTSSSLVTTNLLDGDKIGRHDPRAWASREDGDLETSLGRLFELERLAILFYYSGQPAQAQNLVRAAKKLSAYTLAGIELQLLDEEYQPQPGDHGTQLLEVLQVSPRLRGELALNEAACNGMMGELLECCGDFWSMQLAGDPLAEKEGTSEPMLRLRQAKLIAESGNLALACEIARRVTGQWCEAIHQKPDGFAPAFVYDWKPKSFVEILLGLGLQAEAVQFIEACLLIRPNDLVLIQEYQTILQANQMCKEAGEIARTLLFFEPDNAEWHRRMAEALSGMGRDNDALREVQMVMRLAAEPGLDDWFKLAVAAEKTGDSNLTVKACQEVLRQDPNHGGANALVGQALVHQGKSAEAIEYLSRATISAPEQTQPWLALAELYELQGDEQRSLDTLRAAILAVPDAGEIHFALGVKYLHQNKPSDALPCLREAHRLSPGNAPACLELGVLLRLLGLNEESCRILRDGCISWPQNGSFYVEYGKTCLASAELENAILAFEKAVQLNPKNLDWIYSYAEALLSLFVSGRQVVAGTKYELAFQRARKALEDRILDDNKPALRVRYLLAQLLFVMGEPASSCELYRMLLDDPETAQSELRWRIQAGFGRAALCLGDKETALAALREASQEQPHNLELIQWLVEALRANRLDKEAGEFAYFAMKLAPNNLELLSWFADIMAQLGRSHEAVQALECALQLDPSGVENWLKLIEVYLRANDTAAARAALQKFLLYDSEDAGVLQKIAYICVRLGDLTQAVDCLERAIGLRSENSVEPLIILSVLYEKTGQLERAVESLQLLLGLIPNDPIAQVLQADILQRSGRTQAATACLEHVVSLWENTKAFTRSGAWNTLVELRLATAEWLENLSSPAAAHWRFAGIQYRTGNWDAVQHYIECAVRFAPQNQLLRYAAAECAAGLLKFDRALKLLEEMSENILVSQAGSEGVQHDVLALRVELMIEMGWWEEAGRLVEKGAALYPDSPRLSVLKARQFCRVGKQQDAENLLKTIPGQGVYQTSWMAQGLLEVGRFEEALAIFAGMPAREAENRDPYLEGGEYGRFGGWAAEGLENPRAAFEYGRALTICAEQALLRSSLKVEVHVPPAGSLDETHFVSMVQFLQTALKANCSTMVEKWLARGKLVFHPSAQTALELANMSLWVDDVSALVMGLRRLNRTGNALQWAQKYPDDAGILLQMALCTQKFDAASGLQAMRRAAELHPSDPLMLVGLALLAEQVARSGKEMVSQDAEMPGNGNSREMVFNALEQACEIWPEEPAWHYWAAETASELRREPIMLGHLERAFVLRPQWFEAAYALGKAYLANRQTELAIEILERAADLAPTRSDVCYTLAVANRSLNRLNEALVGAERAASLDRESTAALLLCGEVALELGKLSEAEKFAQSAVQRDKSDVSALLFLSRVQEKQGNKESAFGVLEEALKDFPANLPLLVERVRLAKQVKGFKATLPMIEDAMRQFPNEFQILQLVADAQFECGNSAEAEKIASQALLLQPGDPMLSLLMGRIQQRNGQLDLAVRYFSDVVHRRPEAIDAYLELGATYQLRREYRKALSAYQRARELAPKDYRVYVETANILKEIKDYQNAEDMLRRAVDLAPQDITIRKQLSAVMALNLIQNSPAHKGYSEEVSSYL